jgi:hypothetical protein
MNVAPGGALRNPGSHAQYKQGSPRQRATNASGSVVRMCTAGSSAVAIEVLDIVVKVFCEHQSILFDEVVDRFFASSGKLGTVIEARPTNVGVESRRGVHHRRTHLSVINASDLRVRKMDMRVRTIEELRVYFRNVLIGH